MNNKRTTRTKLRELKAQRKIYMTIEKPRKWLFINMPKNAKRISILASIQKEIHKLQQVLKD